MIPARVAVFVAVLAGLVVCWGGPTLMAQTPTQQVTLLGTGHSRPTMERFDPSITIVIGDTGDVFPRPVMGEK